MDAPEVVWSAFRESAEITFDLLSQCGAVPECTSSHVFPKNLDGLRTVSCREAARPWNVAEGFRGRFPEARKTTVLNVISPITLAE
jgi:hypothetical protein